MRRDDGNPDDTGDEDDQKDPDGGFDEVPAEHPLAPRDVPHLHEPLASARSPRPHKRPRSSNARCSGVKTWTMTVPKSIRIQPPSAYPSVRATGKPFSLSFSRIASAMARVWIFERPVAITKWSATIVRPPKSSVTMSSAFLSVAAS